MALQGYKKKMRIYGQELLKLKAMVDTHPNYYLDKITLVFSIDTGKFLHPSTIWRYMIDGLDYSQQVLSTLAK